MGMIRGPNGTHSGCMCYATATKHESRGMTQTCTVRSNDRSLRSGCARVVKVCEFSSQIPLPQTTRKDQLQCRGTIHNIFEVWMKVFEKYLLLFEKPCFSLNSMYHTIIACILTTADTIPKSSPSRPALSILWQLNCFIYIAVELGWKNSPLIVAVSSENCMCIHKFRIYGKYAPRASGIP